jgi:hypothetical protein
MRSAPRTPAEAGVQHKSLTTPGSGHGLRSLKPPASEFLAQRSANLCWAPASAGAHG